jgi:uncharacterized protein (DUF2342 family)
VTVRLVQRARQDLFAAVPPVFMIATTSAALVLLARTHLGGGNPVLGASAVALLFLTMGVVVVGVARFVRAVNQPRPLPMESAADSP